MARYIDADRLITKIHELYVQPNIELWQVVKCVGNSPTADVVPKSEVEKLNKELDELAEEHSDLIIEKDHLFDIAEKQKAEIERLTINMNAYGLAAKRLAEEKSEIFAEIEKWLVHEYVPYIRGYSNSLARNFAELKKKYVESENG